MATSKRKNFQFSGHETFNLRQNWLYKAVSFCRESLKRGESPNFNGSDAMVSLGVGKKCGFFPEMVGFADRFS